ncbi:MAG: anthranilate synthase component I family protein [Thermoguttaceae bacterium]|nr:anthranilate synthase component I family protein [Thermoguttaceae bacterium]
MLNKIHPDSETFAKIAHSGNAVIVFKEMIADCVTPVAILSHFYRHCTPEKRSGIFLLESRGDSRQTGRYSYLGLGVAKKIDVMAKEIRIVHHDQKDRIETISHEGQPLQKLRELCRRVQLEETPELPDLPFGLVGWFTYEMVSLLESIPIHEMNDTSLASFVIPNEMIVFDNFKQRLYLCILSLDEEKEQTIQFRYEAATARLKALTRELGEMFHETVDSSRNVSRSVRLTPLLDPYDFENRIQKVRQEIIQGEVVQLVLSQPFVSKVIPDPIQLYRAQRLINPSPYMYFLHFDNAIVVGSSPETMVRLKDGRALLRPIAGTRPRGKTDIEDRMMADELLNDEKERAEHLMLVDLGRNDLSRVARVGSVTVKNLMTIERYSHVMHLVSDVTAELEEGCDAFDLFGATFPAGTLSGAPKIRAMQLIHEYEDYPRRYYGGAVGYISFKGEMDFAITIRTATIANGLLTVQAGAGIVYDSIPEKERQETINKAQALAHAIDLIPILEEKE